VKQLRHEIINILGLNRHWKVVLIGAGNLGHALFSHREFKRREFIMVGIFDIIPEAIGQIWGGIEIMHISELPRITRELGVEIGVIATPASSAQEAADRVVEAGIRGILNFAPRKLNVPNHVTLRNVEMAMEIEGLSYVLSGGRFLADFSTQIRVRTSSQLLLSITIDPGHLPLVAGYPAACTGDLLILP